MSCERACLKAIWAASAWPLHRAITIACMPLSKLAITPLFSARTMLATVGPRSTTHGTSAADRSISRASLSIRRTRTASISRDSPSPSARTAARASARRSTRRDPTRACTATFTRFGSIPTILARCCAATMAASISRSIRPITGAFSTIFRSRSSTTSAPTWPIPTMFTAACRTTAVGWAHRAASMAFPIAHGATWESATASGRFPIHPIPIMHTLSIRAGESRASGRALASRATSSRCRAPMNPTSASTGIHRSRSVPIRKGRSILAASFYSGRAIMANPGTEFLPTSPPTIPSGSIRSAQAD
jgi:hypothetical protein